MFKLLLPSVLLLAIVGCDKSAQSETQDGTQRQLIQGMHAEFFKVSDKTNTWFEVAISVDKSKTFRMPVFFSQDGKLIHISDAQAQGIFDAWLKDRAKSIAAFGSIDEQTGLKGPFLAIDVKRWQGK